MECPEENVIVDFVRAELDPDARQQVEEHIDGCPSCAQVVAELAKLEGPLSLDEPEALSDERLSLTSRGSQPRPKLRLPPPLRQGDKLGRYVVLDRVGAGGMGVVYAAYDPELDRKVAIKLLLTSPGGSLPKELVEQRKRLMREAQAMAKLSHPNVITVHDVGQFEGQVFVAMEFIDGITLKEWMASGRRAWREALAVFMAAGRGLASAHAAGLVHRDFKPDNVLIGLLGGRGRRTDEHADVQRVLVTDFGLARPAAGRTDAFMAVQVIESTPVLSAQLTQTGELVGTPAYMAPEQLAGERSDAAADQFGFCVALYEALYGERPFAGERLGELMGNVAAGNLRAPPRDVDVPRWLRRALLRGLATKPDDRYPDMDALLVALSRDPSRRRRVWTAALVPAAVLGIGIWAWQREDAPKGSYCHDVQHRLDAIWSPQRQRAIESALVATGKPFAADAWATAQVRIDDYAQRWTERVADACRAQREGTQPQTVLALRMSCLQRHQDHLAEVLDVLSRGSDVVVERAADVAATLPDPVACDDVERITERLRGLDERADQAQRADLDRLLARARVLRASAEYEQAKSVVLEVKERAEQDEDPWIEAEATSLLADLDDLLGHPAEAEERYHQALAAAIAADHPREIARVAVGLLWVTGREGHSTRWIERWHGVGWAALQRSGHDPELAAQLDNAAAGAWIEHHELERGEALLRRALQIREEAFGPGHPSRSSALGNLGRVLAARGQLDEAAQVFERARQAMEAEYGPHHPDTATALDNLGAVNGDAGRHSRALAFHRKALEIREASLGPDHLYNAHSHYNIALNLREMGRFDEAVEHQGRAIEIYEEGGGSPIDMAIALDAMGSLRLERDEAVQARAAFERAVAILGEQLGAEHRRTARVQMHLAPALARTGDVEQARSLALAASERLEAQLGADHEEVMQAWLSAAEVLQQTGGSSAQVRVLVERVLDKPQVDPELAAAGRDLLAELAD